MVNRDVILEFDGVVTDSVSCGTVCVSNITFSIRAGEVAAILTDVDTETIPLCSLAEGMILPDRGKVTFAGETWDGMNPWQANKMRGRIGRVFEKDGWISNLTVYENIALSERHHTRRTESEIQAEIRKLCRIVDVPDISDERPDMLPASILRRYEWVRAFMGNHILILLEKPERGTSCDTSATFRDLIAKSVTSDAAVLWITSDTQVWKSGLPASARRFKLKTGEMIETGESQ